MNTNSFKTGDIIQEKCIENGRLLTNGLPFTFDERDVDNEGYLSVAGGNSIYVNDINFELVSHANETVEIPVEVIVNILKYCEYNAIYDKLGNYGDFYYKLKKTLKNE